MKVKKKTLILTAGVVWFISGINVVRIGIQAYEDNQTILHGALTILVLLIFGFMFFRMSQKHVRRIQNLEEDVYSIFRFFDLKSYCIMAFMMSGGIWLRYSGLAPIQFIAVFYTGLGLALTLAGLLFLKSYSAECQCKKGEKHF